MSRINIHTHTNLFMNARETIIQFAEVVKKGKEAEVLAAIDSMSQPEIDLFLEQAFNETILKNDTEQVILINGFSLLTFYQNSTVLKTALQKANRDIVNKNLIEKCIQLPRLSQYPSSKPSFKNGLVALNAYHPDMINWVIANIDFSVIKTAIQRANFHFEWCELKNNEPSLDEQQIRNQKNFLMLNQFIDDPQAAIKVSYMADINFIISFIKKNIINYPQYKQTWLTLLQHAIQVPLPSYIKDKFFALIINIEFSQQNKQSVYEVWNKMSDSESLYLDIAVLKDISNTLLHSPHYFPHLSVDECKSKAYKLTRESIIRNLHDVCLMPQLPLIGQETFSTTVITSSGLYQVDEDTNEYKQVLGRKELKLIGFNRYLDEAFEMKKDEKRSIKNDLKGEELALLNEKTTTHQGHTLYGPYDNHFNQGIEITTTSLVREEKEHKDILNDFNNDIVIQNSVKKAPLEMTINDFYQDIIHHYTDEMMALHTVKKMNSEQIDYFLTQKNEKYFSYFAALLLENKHTKDELTRTLLANTSPKTVNQLLFSPCLVKTRFEKNAYLHFLAGEITSEFNGLELIMTQGKTNTLKWILEHVDPLVICKALNRPNNRWKQQELFAPLNAEGSDIRAKLYNLRDFIKDPQHTIIQNTDEQNDALIQLIKNSLIQWPEKKQEWLKIVKKAIKSASSTIRDKLLEIEITIEFSQQKSKSAFKNWTKISEPTLTTLNHDFLLSLSNNLFQIPRYFSNLTEIECKTKALILDHFVATHETSPHKKQEAIRTLNTHLAQLHNKKSNSVELDDIKYEKTMEEMLDSLIENIKQKYNPKKSSPWHTFQHFWQTHVTSTVLQEIITKLTELKTTKSRAQLADMEIRIDTFIHHPRFKFGDKAYLNLLVDTRNTILEILSLLPKEVTQEYKSIS